LSFGPLDGFAAALEATGEAEIVDPRDKLSGEADGDALHFAADAVGGLVGRWILLALAQPRAINFPSFPPPNLPIRHSSAARQLNAGLSLIALGVLFPRRCVICAFA